MDKRQKEYQHQLQLLKQRVSRLEEKGYRFDVEQITKGSEKNVYYATQYFKTLRGEELKKLAIQGTGVDIDNEEDFVPPTDRDSPFTYSVIEEIERIILEFPDMLVVQGDLGTRVREGARDQADVSDVGEALWDMWNEAVSKATREGTLEQLSAYYESVEGKLADLINPYKNAAQYFYESEIRTTMIEALRLLNGGEALTTSQLENYVPLYTEYENIE